MMIYMYIENIIRLLVILKNIIYKKHI